MTAQLTIPEPRAMVTLQWFVPLDTTRQQFMADALLTASKAWPSIEKGLAQ